MANVIDGIVHLGYLLNGVQTSTALALDVETCHLTCTVCLELIISMLLTRNSSLISSADRLCCALLIRSPVCLQQTFGRDTVRTWTLHQNVKDF